MPDEELPAARVEETARRLRTPGRWRQTIALAALTGPFGRVWLGESLSMAGDQLYSLAFVWLVLKTTSATVLAEVLVVGSVPGIVLLLAGGAITDRVSPRLVMAASHLARCGIVTVLLVALARNSVHTWELFAVAGAFGAANAFFSPAAGSITPSLVTPGQLPGANALLSTSEQVTMLLGPLAGGGLAAAGHFTLAFALDAGSFLLAAILVLSVPSRFAGAQATGALHAGIRAGLAYARRAPQLQAILVLVAAGALSYSGVFGVALPALARHSRLGAIGLGAMVSAWGAGQLAGAALAVVTGLPHRWGLLVVGVALCEAATFVIVGFAPSVWVVVALFVPLGALVAYQSDVAIPTWVQSQTPAPLLGRVNSLIELPRAGLGPVSLAMMGGLVSVSIRAPFWAAAVPMLAAGAALGVTRTVKEVRMR